MAGDSLWEGLQQALAAPPEKRLWDGLALPGQQQIGDRMAWRMISPSQNVEDRRGRGTTVADLAHMARMWLQGGPTLLSESHNPNMPSATLGSDISNAVDQIKLESALREMGSRADANARNEAWLRSIEEQR